MRKLVAALACRNKGSRLYGKPLQNLDIEKGITVLDQIVDCLSSVESIDEIVLGISEGVENEDFIDFASRRSLNYIIGDEDDVLSRLISCGQSSGATDILRVTSESPFPYFQLIEESWSEHKDGEFDASFLDDVVDGCGFELLSMASLERSHRDGSERHRSELCTLFIRENKEDFSISYIQAPDYLRRKDLRLTVDYPEDLVVCRYIYEALKHQSPNFNLGDVISFMDSKTKLKDLISPFCEEGYSTMYL